ncbi:MAG TPA: DsbA family protein [Solirubrobacterales bacterium]|jgi:protein-disulfide isomerase|nr:DsbA family protein [Solirubrobacterales bacterium]
MTDLTSAAVPPIGPDDHVRGEGKEGLIVYADLGCPHCAAAWAEIAGRPGWIAFRHFPVASKHPRSPALHAAAEAAGAQGEFFAMVDSIYADRGHVDDPHLWERARGFGLDLERFERDRRTAAVAERVRHDFRSGIRAGVAGTPAVFDACTLVAVREREF